jgi:hypothetical protein
VLVGGVWHSESWRVPFAPLPSAPFAVLAVSTGLAVGDVSSDESASGRQP